MNGIRWGIVGTGTMAELFAGALSMTDGAVLHAVASRRGLSSERFASAFGIPHAYRSYEELLQDPAIDIVYIATRNEHHRDDSLAAIRARKAVLCEKPFALNAAQVREVVDAARREKVFCMEAMWMRFSPAVQEVLDAARNGKIGRPTFVSAELGFPRSDPQDRVFDRIGGGALFDFGVYPLSFVHALLGRPVRVTARAVMGPTGVDHQFASVLEYESGCQAVIAASLCSQLANEVAIHGTNGIIDSIGPLYFPSSYRILQTSAGSSNQITPPRRAPFHLRTKSRIARLVHLPVPADGTIVRRSIANGYACEAAAVQRCLRAGLLEASEMPLEQTIAVHESMDSIRAAWSVEKEEKKCASR